MDDDDKQVSEVGSLSGDPDEPVVDGDATAGYPESESGRPDEGEAGPNAAPRDDEGTGRGTDPGPVGQGSLGS